MNANPPLWTVKGLVLRLKPEVITLLDLHSCYAFWLELGEEGEMMRIRHRNDLRHDVDTRGDPSYVDLGKDNWDDINAWIDAVDLCVEQYRNRWSNP